MFYIYILSKVSVIERVKKINNDSALIYLKHLMYKSKITVLKVGTNTKDSCVIILETPLVTQLFPVEVAVGKLRSIDRADSFKCVCLEESRSKLAFFQTFVQFYV